MSAQSLYCNDSRISSFSGFGDRMFFIYDHQKLKREEDDPKDAIVYFYPNSVPEDIQVIICGQLMGLVRFFLAFCSLTENYQLQHQQWTVCHDDRYTLALAGTPSDDEQFLKKQLDRLKNLFVFYHNSIDIVLKGKSESVEGDFKMNMIWENYLNYPQNYGDVLLNSFETIPWVTFDKPRPSIFLNASHLLEKCENISGVLSGCILHKNKVICTHLPAEITAKILYLKTSYQKKIFDSIDSDFVLPEQVHLIKVYLTDSQYHEIYKTQVKTSYNKKAWESKPEKSLETEKLDSESHVKQIFDDLTQVTGGTSIRYNSSQDSLLHLTDDNNNYCVSDHLHSSNVIHTELDSGISSTCESKKANDDSIIFSESEVSPKSVKVSNVNGSLNCSIFSNYGSTNICSNFKRTSLQFFNKNNEAVYHETSRCRTSSIDLDNTIADPGTTSKSKYFEETSINDQIKPMTSNITSDVNGSAYDQDAFKENIGTVLSNSPQNLSDARNSDEHNLFSESEISNTSTLIRSKSNSCFEYNPSEEDNAHMGRQHTISTDILNEQTQNVNNDTKELFKKIKRKASCVNTSRKGSFSNDFEQAKTIEQSETFFDIPFRHRMHSDPVNVHGRSLNRSLSIQSLVTNPNTFSVRPLHNLNHYDKSLIKKRWRKCSSNDYPAHSHSDIEILPRKYLNSPSRWPRIKSVLTIDSDTFFKRNHSDSQLISQDSSSPDEKYELPLKNSVTSDEELPLNQNQCCTKTKIIKSKISSDNDNSSMRQLDLYVQENSDMMLVLLFEKDSYNDETIRKLCQWNMTLSQLGELDLLLSMSKDDDSEKPQKAFSLKYDRIRKNLDGNVLCPITAAENEFCATVVQMHEAFECNNSLQDVSLRSHSSHIYGHKITSLEVYYQSVYPHRNTFTKSFTN